MPVCAQWSRGHKEHLLVFDKFGMGWEDRIEKLGHIDWVSDV
ncbi:hypothetical protein RG47T_3228 [Mucilaginibacter polytrichastri]|uniref:Uncharacterized protein n=1 Tax=Mucilaginibacter polytrichastri TaxID=1302689 RepID=A0A1Q6A177_9SPHI|nr:hypothetical protein RG47T_3228 [Mucilaginibacter polytrichastri]